MSFEAEGVIKPSDQNLHSLTVYPSAANPLPLGPYDQYKSLPWSGVMNLLAPGDSPFLTQCLFLQIHNCLLFEALDQVDHLNAVESFAVKQRLHRKEALNHLK